VQAWRATPARKKKYILGWRSTALTRTSHCTYPLASYSFPAEQKLVVAIYNTTTNSNSKRRRLHPRLSERRSSSHPHLARKQVKAIEPYFFFSHFRVELKLCYPLKLMRFRAINPLICYECLLAIRRSVSKQANMHSFILI
jgi:hypothetical protein